MSSVTIKDGLHWVGAQDPDLRVFDVVMYTEYGTSYNSFLLKTPKYNVLFETCKPTKMDQFLTNLREHCDPSDLDYIVVDHTEPDHAGSLEHLLDLAPKAKVVGSAVALNFLSNICNREIPGMAVGDGDELKLDTMTLQFLSVPFLHWPDSIYTYIPEIKTLVTCDSFGCHYSDPKVCNDLIKGDFEDAYKYYFDMIMGPFKSHVQYALNRIKPLDIETICPGHGPVLRDNLDYYINLYDQWSQPDPKPERDRPHVVCAYVSAYGYTEQLAKAVCDGMREEVDVDISMYDMVYADAEKVQKEANIADGLLLGTPTINGDALPPVLNIAMNMNGVLHGGKVAGAFGSYGWSGEGPDMLMSRLQVLRMNTIEPALKVNFKPDQKKLSGAHAYGKKFGKRLREEWVKLGTDEATGKTYWKCTVCGEVFEGALPPLTCPVCGAGQEAFIEEIPEVIDFSSNEALKVAIIGGGAGGQIAAESIRKRNPNAEITIYARESVNPYYRPVLTKSLAKGINEDNYYIQSKCFYDRENITLQLGAEVSAIDTNSKTLTVNGETNTYDKLILATGARSFIPPIRGSELPGVIGLREQTHFDELKTRLGKENRRIVVIGGGLLGLETADGLSRLGHDVTVIEACPTILPRHIDGDGAPLLKKKIKNSAVTVKTGVFVSEIDGTDKVQSVITKCGIKYDCDVVIISAGIQSNTDLAKHAGIELGRAIKVNERMETSAKDVYAVGDCAEHQGVVIGLWDAAINQAKVAGANAVGDSRTYQSRELGATLEAFGTKLFSIGDLGFNDEVEYEAVMSRDELTGVYKKLFFRDGKLVGGALLGDVTLTNSLINGVTKGFDVETAKDHKLL